MGFNTVVLIMNDYMHEWREAPHSLAAAMTYPPQSELDLKEWWVLVEITARDHGERLPPRSSLKVLPTFHADAVQLIAAGKNMIATAGNAYSDLKKLKLPDWWSDR